MSYSRVRKLLRSMKEEHRRRASYTLYLQQSRLSLLRLEAALNRLMMRVKREKSLTEECLVDMWITRYSTNLDHLLINVDSRSDSTSRSDSVPCLNSSMHSLEG